MIIGYLIAADHVAGKVWYWNPDRYDWMPEPDMAKIIPWKFTEDLGNYFHWFKNLKNFRWIEVTANVE